MEIHARNRTPTDQDCKLVRDLRKWKMILWATFAVSARTTGMGNIKCDWSQHVASNICATIVGWWLANHIVFGRVGHEGWHSRGAADHHIPKPERQ
jgi:hypothetical protein